MTKGKILILYIIKMDGTDIERVKETFLGVSIDEDLSWKCHKLHKRKNHQSHSHITKDKALIIYSVQFHVCSIFNVLC